MRQKTNRMAMGASTTKGLLSSQFSIVNLPQIVSRFRRNDAGRGIDSPDAQANPRRISRRSAFSLIELLVTLSIIVVLVSVLLPGLGRAREQARRTVCLAHLKQIGLGLLTYAADHKSHGPRTGPIVNRISPRELLSRDGEFINLGLLLPVHVTESELFRCPSAQRHNFDTEAKRMPGATIAGSYAYAAHVPAGSSPKLSIRRQLAMVVDNFVSYQGEIGLGRFTHRAGYNVLYQDGSTSWYADPDESIARRNIRYDNETDPFNYDALYDRDGTYRDRPSSGYGTPDTAVDLVRAWKAFCFNEKDPF